MRDFPGFREWEVAVFCGVAEKASKNWRFRSVSRVMVDLDDDLPRPAGVGHSDEVSPLELLRRGNPPFVGV